MSDAPQANVGSCLIKIDGQENVDLMRDLEEVIVETTYNLPSMATIRVHDPDLIWVDEAALDLGKAVIIEMTPPASTQGTAGQVFEGEIVALEPEFTAQAQHTLVIRAYDKSHRLHIGRKFQTYLDRSDTDIVKELGKAASVTVEADETGLKHEYVLQNNQTDMEFLLARARRIGYQVLLAENKLQFKKAVAVTAGVELTLGEDLRYFKPRLSAAHQAQNYEVRGWDYIAKKEVVGTKPAAQMWAKNGVTKAGGAAANTAFGLSNKSYLVDTGTITADEAAKIAEGFASDAEGRFIEAEGVCFGDAAIQAGKSLTIKEAGTRFSGDYIVTSAVHIYNKKGYEVQFTVSGRMPNTVNHLLDHQGGTQDALGRIFGVVVGVVTSLKDPQDLGRIKVEYPWMGKDKNGSGVNIDSQWARIAAPSAGATRGFYFLPEIQDEVLIAFEQGDPNRPYMVGMLWNGKDKPPEKNAEAADSSGKVNHRILQSRLGHKIVFDDSTDKTSILVEDKTGKQRIYIDSTKNSITVNADGDLTIDVKGNISMKAGGKIDVQAGTSISETAGTEYSMTGKTAKLNSDSTMDVTSKVGTFQANSTIVKGDTVLVDGASVTSIQSALILLN
jgi:uncharacterized protein involved in type VI secretion and phage assembly